MSSVISGFNGDEEFDEEVEYLVSSKEVTLEIALCKISGCFPVFPLILDPLKILFRAQSEILISDMEEVSDIFELICKFESL